MLVVIVINKSNTITATMSVEAFSRFTLASCLLIHMQLLAGNWWVIYLTFDYWPIFWNIFQGFLYLCYPFCGFVSELFYTGKFKAMKWSLAIAVVSSTTRFLTSMIWTVNSHYNSSLPMQEIFFPIAIAVFTFTGLIGLGMYEANAIQFGMDQMLSASSAQLSSFIRWYLWCAHIGAVAITSVVAGVIVHSKNCKIGQSVYRNDRSLKFLWWIILYSSCIELPMSIMGIVVCIYYKKNYSIQQSSRNPLRLVYDVLRYSSKHKYPERRSAFTYWENDTPYRIDLGKQKYGGPFSYEQVENVKTILRLLLLMASLFGFHLSGDGYSISSYVMNTAGCPAIAPLLGFIANPQNIAFLTVALGIPISEILKKYNIFQSVNLLSKIWIGLFFCLVNEALQSVYSAMLTQNREFQCPQVRLWNKSHVPLILKCVIANVDIIKSDSSCEHFCSSTPVGGTVINLSVVIALMHGLAYLLVFTTVLEFICAQSPNETKGLLIGIWYSMLSIKSFFINNMDTQVIMDTTNWNIYHGIKGIGIFLSLAAFSLVCKKYKYRERNETVGEQAMIEEQYERELATNASESQSTISIYSNSN